MEKEDVTHKHSHSNNDAVDNGRTSDMIILKYMSDINWYSRYKGAREDFYGAQAGGTSIYLYNDISREIVAEGIYSEYRMPKTIYR